jgi:hypothetical protein
VKVVEVDVVDVEDLLLLVWLQGLVLVLVFAM